MLRLRPTGGRQAVGADASPAGAGRRWRALERGAGCAAGRHRVRAMDLWVLGAQPAGWVLAAQHRPAPPSPEPRALTLRSACHPTPLAAASWRLWLAGRRAWRRWWATCRTTWQRRGRRWAAWARPAPSSCRWVLRELGAGASGCLWVHQWSAARRLGCRAASPIYAPCLPTRHLPCRRCSPLPAPRAASRDACRRCWPSRRWSLAVGWRAWVAGREGLHRLVRPPRLLYVRGAHAGAHGLPLPALQTWASRPRLRWPAWWPPASRPRLCWPAWQQQAPRCPPRCCTPSTSAAPRPPTASWPPRRQALPPPRPPAGCALLPPLQALLCHSRLPSPPPPPWQPRPHWRDGRRTGLLPRWWLWRRSRRPCPAPQVWGSQECLL